MTIMNIVIPDDLKEAFEKAYPGETITQAIERLLRAEVARKPSVHKRPFDTQTLVEMARDIRDGTPSTSNIEICDVRQEGRS
jgi:hypothetical protein